MVQHSGVELNPQEAELLFEELADWEVILKGTPEVIHKLREFAEAADPEQGKPKRAAIKRSAPVRGPSR